MRLKLFKKHHAISALVCGVLLAASMPSWAPPSIRFGL